MRYLYTFLGITGLILLVITGCQKVPVYQPSMVATIDSLPFSAIGANQVYCDSAPGAMVTVTGATSIFTPGSTVTPVIKLTIPFAVGSYTINNGCSATIFTAETSPSATSGVHTMNSGTSAVSGTIVVAGFIKGRIEGTFNFTCENGQKVTNGQFYSFLPK